MKLFPTNNIASSIAKQGLAILTGALWRGRTVAVLGLLSMGSTALVIFIIKKAFASSHRPPDPDVFPDNLMTPSPLRGSARRLARTRTSPRVIRALDARAPLQSSDSPPPVSTERRKRALFKDPVPPKEEKTQPGSPKTPTVNNPEENPVRPEHVMTSPRPPSTDQKKGDRFEPIATPLPSHNSDHSLDSTNLTEPPSSPISLHDASPAAVKTAGLTRALLTSTPSEPQEEYDIPVYKSPAVTLKSNPPPTPIHLKQPSLQDSPRRTLFKRNLLTNASDREEIATPLSSHHSAQSLDSIDKTSERSSSQSEIDPAESPCSSASPNYFSPTEGTPFSCISPDPVNRFNSPPDFSLTPKLDARSSSPPPPSAFTPIPPSPAKKKVVDKTCSLKGYVSTHTGTFGFDHPFDLSHTQMGLSDILSTKLLDSLKVYLENPEKRSQYSDPVLNISNLPKELKSLGWETQSDRILFLLSQKDLCEKLTKSAFASPEAKNCLDSTILDEKNWQIDKQKIKCFIPNTASSSTIRLTNIFCKKDGIALQFAFFFDQNLHVRTSFSLWKKGAHPLECFPDLSPKLIEALKTSHIPEGFSSLLSRETTFDYTLPEKIDKTSDIFKNNAERCSPSWSSLIKNEWSGTEVDNICRLLSEAKPWEKLKQTANASPDQPWDKKTPRLFFIKEDTKKTILIRNAFFIKEPRLTQYCFLLTPIEGEKKLNVRALSIVWARSAHPIEALSHVSRTSTNDLLS